MSPESEQGASPERRCSPASLDLTVALEWNPEFTLETEPGYEQCRRGRQRADQQQQQQILTMKAFFSSSVWKRP